MALKRLLILVTPAFAACLASENARPSRSDGGDQVGLDAPVTQQRPDVSDIVVAPLNPDTALANPDADLTEAPVEGVQPASWWNSTFSRRRRLTFDTRLTSSGANLSDFPVALRIPANTVDPAAAGVAGADVRFVDAAGNMLARDIETWDSQGSSIAWLK